MSFNVDQVKTPIGVHKQGIVGGKDKHRFTMTNPFSPDKFIRQTSTQTHGRPSELQQRVWEFTNPALLFQSYMNQQSVNEMIDKNPKIKSILKQHGLSANIDLDNINALYDSHLNPTVKYSKGIADTLGLNFYDKRAVERGALFHDFGKVLIPAEILNKTDKLKLKEKQIIDLHSTLGYELLKTSHLSEGVKQIVKNHHKSLNKSPDLRTQIVSVADIYSALTSERPYKQAYTHQQAMQILKNYAAKGKINPQIVNALETYVTTSKAA